MPRREQTRRAVLTMVHNEPVFLPIWLRYYSRFFAPGGHLRARQRHERRLDRARRLRPHPGQPRLRRPHLDGADLEAHQRELLDRYDAVLVTDVDEIVAPRPECGTLGDYIDALDEEFVNCLGYEVIHLVDREPPFDPSTGRSSSSAATGSRTRPTTSRRSRRSRCAGEPGFHGRERRPQAPRPRSA